ncbi:MULTISPECIES: hypothetical protein [unclassified Streptomyces]|uniref:hypothetical protein n=1 Tax=unclassified Streptomyces TaxID=2593676 RepID=UPI00037D1344|nr:MULTISPECIES: hypothetical protein [unclassified Streptomyces]MYX36523.1 hypothetical protein [Streptomyces sp. SID8377]
MSVSHTETDPTRCLKCRRILRRPSPDGLGPKCRAKVRKASRSEAIVAEFKPYLVAKAVELLELGAVVPLRRNRVFLVVSDDGDSVYRTSATGQCNCPAGLRTKPYACYHGISARLFATAA